MTAGRTLCTGSNAGGGHSSDVTLWQQRAGTWEPCAVVALTAPSWVVAHPSSPVVYVTEESDPGAVIVLRVSSGWRMTAQDRLHSRGAGPCHLALDTTASHLIASNYRDGTVARWALTLDGSVLEPPETWRLLGAGPHPERQLGPHAHAAYARDGVLYSIDLGSDRIHALEHGGAVREVLRMPAGFGPRHLEWTAGSRAVLAGELAGEIALVRLGAQPGILAIVDSSCRQGAQPSGIVARDGVAVVANRRVGTLGVFAIGDEQIRMTEEIDLPDPTPRALTIVGDDLFVCLPDADRVEIRPLADLSRVRDTIPCSDVSSLEEIRAPLPAEEVAA